MVNNLVTANQIFNIIKGLTGVYVSVFIVYWKENAKSICINKPLGCLQILMKPLNILRNK